MERYVKYVPLALFLSFSFKGLIQSFTWSDAPILLILGLVAAYYEFKSQDPKFSALDQEIKVLKENNLKILKDLDHLNTSLSGVKLAQGYRSGLANVNR